MAFDEIAQLRRFNRTVTERVGALEAEYLGQGRPLGASRLLWEIGDDGCDVRDLRRRLGLDSGYLSRLLRTLESDGLVATGSSGGDARVRAVRPTPRGRRERAKLDRLSDELAGSILAPLDERQRAQLVEAAATVERLLLASSIQLGPTDPLDPDALWCLEQYYAELAERFEGGFDLSAALPVDPADLTPPRGVILVARLHGEPVACGAVRDLQGFPYLKRMWVARGVRGLGLGRRLLRELEAQAAAVGATSVRLETNRGLGEAIALYRASGYEEVPAFNDERYAHHWFAKRL